MYLVLSAEYNNPTVLINELYLYKYPSLLKYFLAPLNICTSCFLPAWQQFFAFLWVIIISSYFQKIQSSRHFFNDIDKIVV